MDPLAFWRRYSARVAFARFASETDFCSFTILVASLNDASIESRPYQGPRETRHGAGAVRRTNSGFQIFQRALPPRLLPQEPRRYARPQHRVSRVVVRI